MAVAVMSATLETSGLRDYMGASCRVLEAHGRQYPVETVYRGSPAGQRRPRQGGSPSRVGAGGGRREGGGEG